MKKVLLASTALVFWAGLAAAEVSVGGKAGIWLQDNGPALDSIDVDGDADDIVVNYDLDLTFSAEGTTDTGLTFGMDLTLLEDLVVDNQEVYISGAFGKLTVGDVDDALQKVAGLADIGYDGIGIDNVAEQARGDGTAGGDAVLYQYQAGDFGFYVSHSRDTGAEDVAVGVKVGLGDFTVGVGYEDQSDVPFDPLTLAGGKGDVYAVDLSGTFAGAGFDIYYEDSDALGSGYGVVLSYGMGATTVNFGYSDHDAADDAAYGLGFAYDLGGAELAGGVGDNGSETVWDLGVSMEF